MPIISVLMSVYNEDEVDLRTSIDSILNQTYSDFEFIIVNDNPDNNSIKELINFYTKKDHRIKAIFNEENIGLAESLNRAANIAKGSYILRMDADDISVPDRIEKQLEIIRKNNYDLVCSNYYFINESGKVLERDVKIFNNEDLIKTLPKENVVHHPTVIMKANVFSEMKGYRNFPCAQDYDLWLRMLSNKCTFHMMPEKLLYYRIRSNSITGKNKLKQIHTIKYIKEIFLKYRETGIDEYDYDEYAQYIQKVHNKRTVKDFNRYYLLYQEGLHDLKNKRITKGLKKIVPIIIKSKYFRGRFIEKAKSF